MSPVGSKGGATNIKLGDQCIGSSIQGGGGSMKEGGQCNWTAVPD